MLFSPAPQEMEVCVHFMFCFVAPAGDNWGWVPWLGKRGDILIIDANVIRIFLFFLSPKNITGSDIYEQLPKIFQIALD